MSRTFWEPQFVGYVLRNHGSLDAPELRCIEPDWFEDQSCAQAWRAIQALRRRGLSYGLVETSDELERTGGLKKLRAPGDGASASIGPAALSWYFDSAASTLDTARACAASIAAGRGRDAEFQARCEAHRAIQEAQRARGARPIEFYPLLERLQSPPEPPQWLVTDWIGENWIFAISGVQKVGKSTFAQGLACALALGQDFAGSLIVPQQALVFYSDDEQNEAGALRRWDQLGGRAAAESGRLQFLHHQRLRVDSAQDTDRIIEGLQPIREAAGFSELPAVLLVDSKKKLFRLKEENSNSEDEARCQEAIRLSNELRCAIGLIAHSSPNVDGSRKRMRGNTNFGDNVDVCIAVDREPSSRVTTLSRLTCRWENEIEAPDEFAFQIEQEGPGGSQKFVGLGVPAPDPTLQLAYEAISQTDGTTAAAVIYFESQGKTKSSFDQKLRTLKASGYVRQRQERGRYILTDKPFPSSKAAE